MKKLDGKVALVTGAARGIGEGIALCMADEGADSAINDCVPIEECHNVVEAITAKGRKARAWQADVANRQQVAAMIKEVTEHFGRLDIAVANAAFNMRETVIDSDSEAGFVERVIAVTQLGAFYTCRAAAQEMMRRGEGGKIIVISSIHASLPFASNSAYNMAKAAVNHMARTLANEVARYHINVNVIEPGWIDTPGVRRFSTEQELQEGARRIPWGRLGTPTDIGRSAVFLASEESDYITGACLRVDGGYSGAMTLPQLPPES